MSREEFIETMGTIIKEEASFRGYKYPSAILAQAILESGFGTSELSYRANNYFGMKCGRYWNGASVSANTWEEYNGRTVDITDNFRKYNDMRGCVIGYFDFISTSRYANLREATSAYNYIETIKADGYATDSRYVDKCKNIIDTYNLTRFDNNADIDELAVAVIRG